MTDDLVRGATIAITGGTGSFGSTMARHLLDRGVEQVRVLSRDEAKQDEMRQRFGDPRLRFVIGDVRDAGSVTNALRGVDYVFHAAALKQVPSCEFFPVEAVRTNVLGSQNVIAAADQCGVRTVVCLSTDKAVYPINAMGMSKALMEKNAQAFARNNPGSATTVAITRYGNVMYSRGSVIPVFVRQLQSGKPLTVTEPTMTRFLMSLAESVDLVEHAFAHARPGDLFVRKAPAATVEVLAAAVARLLGFPDAEIAHLGIRHGEKLHETLVSREEMAKAVDEGDYYRIPLDARSLEYELYLEDGQPGVASIDEYTSASTTQLDVEGTMRLLGTLPEVQAILEATR